MVCTFMVIIEIVAEGFVTWPWKTRLLKGHLTSWVGAPQSHHPAKFGISIFAISIFSETHNIYTQTPKTRTKTQPFASVSTKYVRSWPHVFTAKTDARHAKRVATLVKKRLWHRCLPENSKSTFLYRTPLVAASGCCILI